jgi:hypothetical protein
MGDNPLTWLGNGYTVADYDGSSRTSYLDPTLIDYPPIPEEMSRVNGKVNGDGADYEKIGIKDPADVDVVQLLGTTAA